MPNEHEYPRYRFNLNSRKVMALLAVITVASAQTPILAAKGETRLPDDIELVRIPEVHQARLQQVSGCRISASGLKLQISESGQAKLNFIFRTPSEGPLYEGSDLTDSNVVRIHVDGRDWPIRRALRSPAVAVPGDLLLEDDIILAEIIPGIWLSPSILLERILNSKSSYITFVEPESHKEYRVPIDVPRLNHSVRSCQIKFR